MTELLHYRAADSGIEYRTKEEQVADFLREGIIAGRFERGARLKQVDIAKMLSRKEGIVEKMTKGIEFLFRKNKITWLKGHGKFMGKSDAGVQIEIRVALRIGDPGADRFGEQIRVDLLGHWNGFGIHARSPAFGSLVRSSIRPSSNSSRSASSSGMERVPASACTPSMSFF